MRVLLRNWKTGHYFQMPENWSEDRHSATDFEHVATAIDFTVAQKIQDVEVVLAFPDPKLDLKLQAGLRISN